jgi:hypothetical protein
VPRRAASTGRKRKRWYGRRGGRGQELTTASEIASFAYCPEAWRLEYGLGLEAGNQSARDAGERHHAGKAIAERLAGLAIRLGQGITLAALLLLLVLGYKRACFAWRVN